MATKEQVDGLTDNIKICLEFINRGLIRRAEWGEINFDAVEDDINRVKNFLTQLSDMPLKELPKNAIKGITQATQSLSPKLEEMNSFRIDDAARTNQKRIIDGIRPQIDGLYNVAGPWLPFLAYQKGDVQENIKKLVATSKKIYDLHEETLEHSTKKKKEIDDAVSAAQTASAAAGAAVFTKEFEDEGKENKKAAGFWLWWTLGFLGISIIILLILWCQIDPKSEETISGFLQLFGIKLVLFSILVSAAIWCGRQYKTLTHLATMNKHRALSLKTLEAFLNGASDPQTKDAVLMESARSVFQAGQTGFLEGKEGQISTPMQVVEVSKLFKSQ